MKVAPHARLRAEGSHYRRRGVCRLGGRVKEVDGGSQRHLYRYGSLGTQTGNH